MVVATLQPTRRESPARRRADSIVQASRRRSSNADRAPLTSNCDRADRGQCPAGPAEISRFTRARDALRHHPGQLSGRLRQVLTNLIFNAVTHGFTGPGDTC